MGFNLGAVLGYTVALKPLTGITSAGSTRSEAPPPRQRSAVTNGRRLFVEGDENSAWSRRYRNLIACHVSDLGGRDGLSEAQLSLDKRASAIELESKLKVVFLWARKSTWIKYTRAAGHLRARSREPLNQNAMQMG